MGADQNSDWHRAIASALEWWSDAGVDVLADEAVRDWAAAPDPVPDLQTPPARARAKTAIATPITMPRDFASFAVWRAGEEVPEARWPGPAILAQGPSDSDVMVLVDQPEREDASSGMLVSGVAGRLLDAMLAAIGHSRATVHLAAICTKRAVAGRIAPEVEAELFAMARHHVELVAPKRILLLGDAASRAVCGMNSAHARGSLRALNSKEGSIGATEAVASFHPRFLLENPARKAEAWRDLQMLTGRSQ